MKKRTSQTGKRDGRRLADGKNFMRRTAKGVVIIVALVIGSALFGFAQNRKMTLREKEEAWRAERLRKRAAEERREFISDSIQHVQAITAIREGAWALEASNITFDNSTTRFVTPSTNFVSINNGTGTIQTAFDNTNVYSPNGLGGITLEGGISGEELKVDNEGNIYYNYVIQGSNVSATVSIVITANSNQATANVNPNFSSRNMLMSGYIYPYDEAGVIQGTADY
jgi:hypothetical protein